MELLSSLYKLKNEMATASNTIYASTPCRSFRPSGTFCFREYAPAKRLIYRNRYELDKSNYKNAYNQQLNPTADSGRHNFDY